MIATPYSGPNTHDAPVSAGASKISVREIRSSGGKAFSRANRSCFCSAVSHRYVKLYITVWRSHASISRLVFVKEIGSKTCPKCGSIYTQPSALSREDSITPICPDCGILESLAWLGLDEEEQEHILGVIRQYRGNSEKENQSYSIGLDCSPCGGLTSGAGV